MTAQPVGEPASYEVINAPSEALKQAEIDATLSAHREWVAAGRPGAVPHQRAMAELLGQQ